MLLQRLTTFLLILAFATLHALADEGTLYTSDRLTSNSVSALVQDADGYIWIGTRGGLNRFDGYRFTPYLYSKDDTCTLPHNNIVALYTATDGRLFAGTPKGLAVYDAAIDNFRRIRLRPGNEEPRCLDIVETPEGKILVGTSGFGVYELERTTLKPTHIRRFEVGSDDAYFNHILIDRQGRFWRTGVDNTLYCFSTYKDAKPRLLLTYRLGDMAPLQLKNGPADDVYVVCDKGLVVFPHDTFTPKVHHANNSAMNCATFSHDYNLLVGTSGNGLYQFNPFNDSVSSVDIRLSFLDFVSTGVTALLEDRQHNLWVGCDNRGLLFQGHGGQPFQGWQLASQGVQTGSYIYAATHAAGGGVWCAVYNGYLYRFDTEGHIVRTVPAPVGLNTVYRNSQGQLWVGAGPRLYRFDEAAGRLSLERTFEGTVVQAISDDGHGTLYISDFTKGMTAYNPSTHASRNYNFYQRDAKKGNLCNNWIINMLRDSQGLVWCATSSGTACYDPAADSFRKYGWNNLLEGYFCISLAETPSGDILIGTDSGLFRYDRKRNKVEPFHKGSRLNDLYINAIVCTPEGDVWCATTMGLWHYNPRNGQTYGHVSDGGLREREYTNVGLRLGDGRIVMGNSEGLVVFRPDEVGGNGHKPAPVRLTSMLVGGERVNVSTLSDGRVITAVPVDRSESFALSYLDASFTMEFSTFDYSEARNLVVEYRMNDDPWQRTVSGGNAISFNHLQPGFYKLYVRTIENGKTSDTMVYNVTIRGPWYTSATAYALYLVLFVAIAAYVGWRYRRRRLQQLSEAKMQFLINATHDIRTPLTLVLNPLRQLTTRFADDAEAMEKLGIIDRNAHRILTLVNQILDIRRLDKQQLRLQCQATLLAPFVQRTCKSFEAHAQERGIAFNLALQDDVEAWVDQVQFDKVVQNLLSNAFKFTPDGGAITVSLAADGASATLSVTDTGTGLREADIPKLFTRFYQSASNQAAGREGTGIGLNLCKKVVELHHGKIAAANRHDGQRGSVFSVSIPFGHDHLKPEELKPVEEAPKAETPKTTASRGHILLVDDDAEITDYITGELSSRYRCHACLNGKEALHELLAGTVEYSLVVSDIMMPEMDGFTLLRTIKSNPLLSHLPVILLTSEAAVGNRLEGLQQGADAFLAKPFLIEELQGQIDNLIAKGVRLRNKFSGEEEQRKEQVEQREVADVDKQLLDRIMASINKHLSDSDFSVEQLAADVGLSRSQLHRKMKELTGVSPSDFIRNLRLEQAARLLRERKVNVSQVAYSLGFNTLGNFSKAFKQHFGMPPTEYAAKGE